MALLFQAMLLMPPPAAAAIDPTCAFSDRYPVDIPILGSEQARTVVDQNIDIDAVSLPEGPAMPGVIRAYVNDRERAALEGLGFEVRQVPNEAKEMWAKVKNEWSERETRKEIAPPDRAWPTYPELEADLQAVAAAHPSICQLVSLGQTVQGRTIWIMKISDNVTIEENEPEFKFTSSIHGDEVVGMELCRRMIHLLAENYGTDPRITNLVDNAELWFCCMHNPDGFVNGTRYNAHGVDLNRNFPDPITDPHDTPTGREIENQNFMYFGYAHNFILSANYHGGSLVMNLPWDCQYADPPDNAYLWDIGTGYSYRNPPMYAGQGGIGIHGVINGADWYVIHGGMQDWCYNWRNEMDITIEVSQIKWPSWSAMDTYWDQNREAMLYYMERTIQDGVVQGTVTDATNGEPLSVTVNVTQINKVILSDPDLGDYHRLLMPGTYTLTFSKTGYDTQTFTNIVVNSGAPTQLDVAMPPVGSGIGPEGLDSGLASARVGLSRPEPNPASSNHPAGLVLAVPAAGRVSAGVYDLSGRCVRNLLGTSSQVLAAGTHAISWDGKDDSGAIVAAGMYWVRVMTATGLAARPVVWVR